MYQFFVETANVSDSQVLITGSDVNHIVNVLRMKKGERVRISDDSGRSYYCHLENLSESSVTAVIEEEDLNGTELFNDITLYQGLPKSDKMELIIQKAVELGAKRIVPVKMKNCVMKLDDKKVDNKIKRWQTIALTAAKQSKRTLVPEIAMPMTFKEALKEAAELDINFVPYENERGMANTRELFSKIERGQSIGIMVGPEGGFAGEEIELVDNEASRNSHKISLGRRILRTETAGLATLSMLVYQLDD